MTICSLGLATIALPTAGPARPLCFAHMQLKAFRAGNRDDIDGNMTSIASTLSDTDIATLADCVSGFSSP